MLQLGKICIIVGEEVRFMAMTATASMKARNKVSSTIGFLNPTVVAMSPSKMTITINISNFISISENFGPALYELI